MPLKAWNKTDNFLVLSMINRCTRKRLNVKLEGTKKYFIEHKPTQMKFTKSITYDVLTTVPCSWESNRTLSMLCKCPHWSLRKQWLSAHHGDQAWKTSTLQPEARGLLWVRGQPRPICGTVYTVLIDPKCYRYQACRLGLKAGPCCLFVCLLSQVPLLHDDRSYCVCFSSPRPIFSYFYSSQIPPLHWVWGYRPVLSAMRTESYIRGLHESMQSELKACTAVLEMPSQNGNENWKSLEGLSGRALT